MFQRLAIALRTARQRAGFDSQEEAAEAAGLGRAMLSRYERGKAEPSLKTLERLLTAYELSLSEFGFLLESEGDEPSELDQRLRSLEDSVEKLTRLVEGALVQTST